MDARDDLRPVAELKRDTEHKERFWAWNHMPVIYTVMAGLFGLLGILCWRSYELGVYTQSVDSRLSKVEELSVDYKNDHILETVRNNKAYVEELRRENTIEVLHQVGRNQKQLKALNSAVFKTPDPGADQ